ncbi:hypothetical protein OAC89_04485 [Deltaproteobacteria bacterium]|nr:hypothetical protein [Deltaproteobacteria bacterium]
MKNSFFMIISFFLPLTLLNLFAEENSSLAQPQQGQPQRGSSLSQGLEAYSLPTGTITENDVPGIKTVIEQVLNKISEPVKSAGKKADYQTIKSSILTFQDWLKAHGCVSQASTTYDIENTDRYSEHIFFTYPGQLPFDIIFNMGEDMKKPYRLLIFIDQADLFNFGSLIENKTIDGVPAMKNWPSDYLEKRLES